MTTKEKKSRARLARGLVVIGAVSLVLVGAFIEACGLDDSVVDETGQNSGSDATIGDGTIPDGATRLPDGEIIFVDAGPDGTIHETADAADPDDADLTDAALSDGSCAGETYACSFGGNTYCLGDCASCSGNHYACERSHMCGSSCSSCEYQTECIRAGFFGDHQYCVADPPSCSLIGGSPVFCGQLPFVFIDCPGTDEVCVSNQCITCGENTSTKNATCSPSANGKCNGSGPSCH
jgi:hypothetical protein